jgi:hypothetical protein
VVLFHGLEGSSNSHYARSLMAAVAGARLVGAIPHFRGCSGEANLAPRFYHSGDAEELDWIIRRLRARAPPVPSTWPASRWAAMPCCAGWASSSMAPEIVDAAVAVSAPLDLAAGGAALSSGFNRLYTRMFLQTLKPKAWPSWSAFPACSTAPPCSPRATCTASTTSSPRRCTATATPTTTGTAPAPARAARHHRADPGAERAQRSLPAGRAPAADGIERRHAGISGGTGGHVGFPVGPFPGHIDWLPRRILHFFDAPAPAKLHARARGRTMPSLTSMDDIVKQAMAKWPNVPHCYGWLALDARGTGACATKRPSAPARPATS